MWGSCQYKAERRGNWKSACWNGNVCFGALDCCLGYTKQQEKDQEGCSLSSKVMDNPETAVSPPQPFLNCHRRPLSTQSSVILQRRLLNTPLWFSQVICWTGQETCAEFPRLQCLALVRRRFAPRLNMCNIKRDLFLALLYLLLNLNYVQLLCVYVYVSEGEKLKQAWKMWTPFTLHTL